MNNEIEYSIWSINKDGYTCVYETSELRRGTQIILQVPSEVYHLPRYDSFKPFHERSDFEEITKRRAEISR